MTQSSWHSNRSTGYHSTVIALLSQPVYRSSNRTEFFRWIWLFPSTKRANRLCSTERQKCRCPRNQKRHYLIIAAVEWHSFELFINIYYRSSSDYKAILFAMILYLKWFSAMIPQRFSLRWFSMMLHNSSLHSNSRLRFSRAILVNGDSLVSCASSFGQ